MSATGKLDRPGGSVHFEIIDATPRWTGDAPGDRALRAFLDRRAA